MTVEFSNGSSPGLLRKDGAKDDLIVTRDHLLLMPNNNLKREELLVPEQDKLVLYDGRETLVIKVQKGAFNVGVHHIATSKAALSTSMEWHLLNSKGIVSANYALQLGALGC